MVRFSRLLSNYYHIFLILQELHQKLSWHNFEDGINLPKDKTEKKKLYSYLKQKKYARVSDYSVEVLLQVLQKLLRELDDPLLSFSDVLHRRWMDIGDYVNSLQSKEIDSDIRPDLILHIARFIHTYYDGYHLLVLQYLLGMMRRLCGKMHPHKVGFRFNEKMLSQLCNMFAPYLFHRPSKYPFLSFRKNKRQFSGEKALFFIVVKADEIFATDQGAILQNLPPKLLTHRLPLFLVCELKAIKKN